MSPGRRKNERENKKYSLELNESSRIQESEVAYRVEKCTLNSRGSHFLCLCWPKVTIFGRNYQLAICVSEHKLYGCSAQTHISANLAWCSKKTTISLTTLKQTLINLDPRAGHTGCQRSSSVTINRDDAYQTTRLQQMHL